MTVSKPKRTKRKVSVSVVILLLIALYVGLCLLLPIRSLKAANASTTLSISTPVGNLPWPKYGEAAVGLQGQGVIQSHGPQIPKPTASVAKLITALAVLKKYPLSVGQQGPMITIDATDYGFYTKYVSEQGSVVPVYSGEQLSELQMLEAMLIPSGNNIADSLARWAYGSVASYDSFANNYVKQLGMTSTTVAGDASGFLPSTTSTADDLIKLGEFAMANPVIAQIVGMKSVTVPNVGVMDNYDNILGTSGIVGIKTGNSNQAGGVFLSAANTKINAQTVTILTAIMGAPQLPNALSDTVPLVVSLENDFNQTVLVSKGEVLGEFREPWGGNVQIGAADNLTVYLLQGQQAKAKLTVNPLKVPSANGTQIGTITSLSNQFNQAVSVPIVTLQPTTKPSLYWRLLHPWEEI